jgi:hypothetical protein
MHGSNKPTLSPLTKCSNIAFTTFKKNSPSVVEPEPVPLGTETFCLSGTRTGTAMHSGFRSRAEIKWNDKNKKKVKNNQ